jgi:hypothetical protein
MADDEAIKNFFAGHFSDVKLNKGNLIMKHPGVRPYDWFKNTGFGSFMGAPFEQDLEQITEKIELLVKKQIEIIVR